MAQARALPRAKPIAFNRYLALIYLLMAAGLAVTALVATSVSTNKDLIMRIMSNPWFAFGLFILQIIVVVGISASVMRLSPGVAVWDTQRLKQLTSELQGRQAMGGIVVLGALSLYLDFINLFLLLLRTSRR